MKSLRPNPAPALMDVTSCSGTARADELSGTMFSRAPGSPHTICTPSVVMSAPS